MRPDLWCLMREKGWSVAVDFLLDPLLGVVEGLLWGFVVELGGFDGSAQRVAVEPADRRGWEAKVGILRMSRRCAAGYSPAPGSFVSLA